MTKKRTIIILCVALCFGAAGYLLSRRPVRPNVILIMSETLRTDHLGCYGYDRDTTPNIDAFAGGAALFTNAYTQAPCTDPAIFNVMTSRYYASIPLDDDYFTLAEYFREKEYRTAAFIANSAANPNTSHLYQGFESYDFGSRRRRGGSVTGAAMRWIEHVGKKRFFTWLFYFDPHRPHVAPKDFRGYYAQSEKLSGDEQEIARYMKSLSLQGKKISPEDRQLLIDAYDEEIRYLDTEVGRFLSYLKREGLYDSSIIIFTADHGEELGDNGGRWGHCMLLSQEEIHVPLIIKMPRQKGQVVIKEAVQTIDIYPTLVAYLDGKRAPDSYDQLCGTSLLPLVRGSGGDTGRFAASFWKDQRCIIAGGVKYWVHKGRERFVALDEGRGIIDERTKEMLRAMLDEATRKHGIDDDYYHEKVEYLKSIGYLQ